MRRALRPCARLPPRVAPTPSRSCAAPWRRSSRSPSAMRGLGPRRRTGPAHGRRSGCLTRWSATRYERAGRPSEERGARTMTPPEHLTPADLEERFRTPVDHASLIALIAALTADGAWSVVEDV